MNAVEMVRGLIEVGASIELVENTYRPELNGTRRTIEKVQRESYAAIEEHSGETVWGALPKRVREVVSVDETQATFYIDDTSERLTGHTITIRRVG